MLKASHIFMMFTAAYFLSYFYRSANAVISQDLSTELSLSAQQLGFMTSLFFATFALIQLPLGVGLDRWGPRWVTPGLMLLGVIGSVIFGLANSFWVLAVGRGLIGFGMAGILMGSLKMFSQWFSTDRFATVSGLLVGIGSSGALVAATPLAWLNNTVGWRTVFFFGAAMTFLVATTIAIWSRNTPPGVTWQGGQQGDGSVMSVLGDLRFWRIAPSGFFTTGTLLAFQGLWAGPYLFDVLNLTEIEAGNVLLFMGIGTTTGFMVSGWLADKIGLTQVIVTSTVIFILAQFALILQPPLLFVYLIYILFGFCGAFNIMMLAHARKIFPSNITGRVVSAVNLFGIGGTFFIQWWLGLIIGSFAVNSAGQYPPQAYTAALLFTGIGGLLALFWYLPLTRSAAPRLAEG